MSGFTSLRSSMRSISGPGLVLGVLAQEGEMRHTGDIMVENVIFDDGTVDDPLCCLVDNQDFPLEKQAAGSEEGSCRGGAGRQRGAVGGRLTSFWAVLRMASMMAVVWYGS
jgi:hypothetical protein